MNSTLTERELTRIEQDVFTRISDDLCEAGIELYRDRDEYGVTAFLVCRNTRTAREILEDSPALYEIRGNSLIVAVRHPDRNAS